jgi:hypothetical protein
VPKATKFTKSTENLGGKVTTPSGGGSPQKLERTKKSSLIDRYKEIND